jgi:DHA1 family bicyclomycin/chloramphenicol resistance-like MFS transporter
LIYALNFAAIFSFVSVSPLLLMERLHVTRNAYTVMFGSTLIGTVLGSSLSSALSRRAYSARKTISLGLPLMMGASLLALVLQWLHARSPYAILLPAFVTFVCFGLTSPVLTLEALGPFPRLAGAGSGAIRALQMIFGAAASSALAYICASPRVRPGIATTLTMTLTTAAGFALVSPFRKPGLMVSNADAGPGMLDPDIDIDILGH